MLLLTDILLGTMSVAGLAAGVSALVLYRKNNGNGPVPNPWRYDPLGPPPPIRPPVRFDPVTVKGLDELPARIEGALSPMFAEVLVKMEHLAQRQAEITDNPPVVMTTIEPTWPTELQRSVETLSQKLDGLRATSSLVSDQALERLDALVAAATTPEQEQEVQVKGLTDIPGQIARSLSGMIGRGGGGNPSPPPPPRRDPPPNLAAIPPGTQPTVPQIPAAYVGGSVFATAGQVTSLLVLIQYQLSPNCPGTSAEFSISAQDASVFVGAASALGGPLSDINYAYELTPGGPPRIYRSSFPGNNTPIGELQVLSPTGGYINVEVQS